MKVNASLVYMRLIRNNTILNDLFSHCILYNKSHWILQTEKILVDNNLFDFMHNNIDEYQLIKKEIRAASRRIWPHIDYNFYYFCKYWDFRTPVHILNILSDVPNFVDYIFNFDKFYSKR